MRSSLIGIILILMVLQLVRAQDTPGKVDTIVYKKIDSVTLIMKVIYPPSVNQSKPFPAMVFFFGGGWKEGSIKQFEPQANYFAKRGMVCFLAEYRIASKHGTYIKEAIMDAKSAIRYIRANSKTFQIDENKIVASGGSAGGHLAAATCMIDDINDTNDNTTVSAVPGALILFNPALDLLQMSEPLKKIGKNTHQLSPLQNMKSGLPPAIIFHGDADEVVPVSSVQQFKTEALKFGNRCELNIYKGAKHGFFNLNRSESNFKKTVYEADEFLISLAYLRGKPTIADQK